MSLKPVKCLQNFTFTHNSIFENTFFYLVRKTMKSIFSACSKAQLNGNSKIKQEDPKVKIHITHYIPTPDNFQFNNMNIMGVISKFNENLKPILPPCNHDKLTDRLGSLSDGPKRCSLRISTPDIIANYLTHLKALSAPLMYRAYA